MLQHRGGSGPVSSSSGYTSDSPTSSDSSNPRPVDTMTRRRSTSDSSISIPVNVSSSSSSSSASTSYSSQSSAPSYSAPSYSSSLLSSIPWRISLFLTKCPSISFTTLAGIDTTLLPASSPPRTEANKKPAFQSYFLQLSHDFFHLPSFFTVFVGMCFFFFLCFLPTYTGSYGAKEGSEFLASSGASGASTLRHEMLDHLSPEARYELEAQKQDARMSHAEMRAFMRDALFLDEENISDAQDKWFDSLEAGAREQALENIDLVQEHSMESWSGWLRNWSPLRGMAQSAVFRFTPAWFDPFVLGYQTQMPRRLQGRTYQPQTTNAKDIQEEQPFVVVSHEVREEVLPSGESVRRVTPVTAEWKLSAKGDQHDAANPALKAWLKSQPFDASSSSPSSIPQEGQAILWANQSSSRDFVGMNKHWFRKEQLTMHMGQEIPNTIRLRMSRDYESFPSSIPSFITAEPLKAVEEAANARLKEYVPLEHTVQVQPETPDPKNFFSPERILVLYVFAYNHDEYLVNLESFIRDCVRESALIDYVFLINQLEGREIQLEKLPELPSNARYIPHKNECLDWGTIGWLIDLQAELNRDAEGLGAANPTGKKIDPTKSKYHLELSRYKYFMIMNSSVRGPYFPSYIDVEDPRNHWWVPFLHMMKRDPVVKMLGPLINCQFNPHVQSYVLVLDQTSFSILRGISADKIGGKASTRSYWSTKAAQQAAEAPPSSVFFCHDTYWDAVQQAEVGSGYQMIKEGYNIASVALMYSGINFRSAYNQDCLGMGQNPSQNTLYGAMITSGPDAGHIQRQVELLVAHQNWLYNNLMQKQDEDDLEGDILSDEERADLARFRARLVQEQIGSDEDDFDFSGQQQAKKGFDLDLSAQLRIIGSVKKSVLRASIQKLLDDTAQQTSVARLQLPATLEAQDINVDSRVDLAETLRRNVPSVIGDSVGATAVAIPLLFSSERMFRRRPDLLIKQTGSFLDSKFDMLGQEMTNMVDLKFLRELSKTIESYRSPYLTDAEALLAQKQQEWVEEFARANPFKVPHINPIFDTPEPLTPDLLVKKYKEAYHRVQMKQHFADAMEVMFGKWKSTLQMNNLARYEKYREFARMKRIHNYERAARIRFKEWKTRSATAWTKAWDEVWAEVQERWRKDEKAKLAEEQAREAIEQARRAAEGAALAATIVAAATPNSSPAPSPSPVPIPFLPPAAPSPFPILPSIGPL